MLDRRSMLRLMGGTATCAAGMGAAGIGGALAAPGLNLSRDDDFLTAAVKLRGSTDDRLCIGWVIGTRYAVIDHVAIPIMGILAGTFSQYRKISEDAYSAKSLEVAYFTDLKTGSLLETWENPVTGKVVEVPQIRMGPASLLVSAQGLTVERAAEAVVDMELRHRFNPAVIRGNDVWVTEVINVDATPSRPGAEHFVYNEMTTYHGLMSDLEDPGQATVPTQVSFHGLVTWRPWMGFGDMPGHTTAHGTGARAGRVEDLPKYYLELTERHHPDVLDDPLGLLE
jgi:hypothetical protein